MPPPCAPHCFAAKNLLQISIEYSRIKRKSRPSLPWIELGAPKFMIKLSALGFQNHILVYCSGAREYCLVPAGCRTDSSSTHSMSPIRESVCWSSAAQNILAVVGASEKGIPQLVFFLVEPILSICIFLPHRQHSLLLYMLVLLMPKWIAESHGTEVHRVVGLIASGIIITTTNPS